MIEDELRTLLTERAGDVPDNPTRREEVRSRIAVTRRRRVAGAAIGLLLVALAGFLVTRLPSPNESLPPGVPAPPWFNDDGRVRRLPGFLPMVIDRQVDGTAEALHLEDPGTFFEYLLLVWCERPGEMVVRNPTSGSEAVVACRTPVGEHHEGALLLPPEQAEPLWRLSPEANNLTLVAGSPGRWYFTLARSTLPIRLAAASSVRWLAEGPRTPEGTTVQITVPTDPPGPDVPPDYGVDFRAECVEGVDLTFDVPGGQLGSISCRSDNEVPALTVPASRLAELGLRRGDRVPLTIRSTGRQTDQWRVFPIP